MRVPDAAIAHRKVCASGVPAGPPIRVVRIDSEIVQSLVAQFPVIESDCFFGTLMRLEGLVRPFNDYEFAVVDFARQRAGGIGRFRDGDLALRRSLLLFRLRSRWFVRQLRKVKAIGIGIEDAELV